MALAGFVFKYCFRGDRCYASDIVVNDSISKHSFCGFTGKGRCVRFSETMENIIIYIPYLLYRIKKLLHFIGDS